MDYSFNFFFFLNWSTKQGSANNSRKSSCIFKCNIRPVCVWNSFYFGFFICAYKKKAISIRSLLFSVSWPRYILQQKGAKKKIRCHIKSKYQCNLVTLANAIIQTLVSLFLSVVLYRAQDYFLWFLPYPRDYVLLQRELIWWNITLKSTLWRSGLRSPFGFWSLKRVRLDTLPNMKSIKYLLIRSAWQSERWDHINHLNSNSQCPSVAQMKQGAQTGGFLNRHQRS